MRRGIAFAAVMAGLAAACGQILGLTDPRVDDGLDASTPSPDGQGPAPDGDRPPSGGDAAADQSAPGAFCVPDAHTFCDDFDDGADPRARWTVNAYGGEAGLTDAFAASLPFAFGGAWVPTAPPDAAVKGAISLSRNFSLAGAKTLTVAADFLVHDQNDDVSFVRIDTASSTYWEVSLGVSPDRSVVSVFVQDATLNSRADPTPFTIALQEDAWYRVVLTLDLVALTYAYTVTAANGEVRASLSGRPIYALPAGETALQANFGAKFDEWSRGAVYVDDVVVDLGH